MPLATIRWSDRQRQQHEATIEEFLAYCASDPLAPTPYPVAASMLAPTNRPTEGLSVTQLLSGCVRCQVIQKYEDYSERIEDLWFRWRGSMFHKVLEGHAPPDSITEVRFYAQMPHGLGEVHGQPDLVWRNAISDYKTTKRIPLYGPWGNHVSQLQLYRWLIQHATRWDGELGLDPRTLDIERLIVVYIDEQNVKPMEVTTSRQVATKPGAKNATKTVREPLIWTNEEVEAQLVSSYEDLATAMEMYENNRRLPPYPPSFDFIGGFEHQFSPTARTCVERHIEEQSLAYR